MIGPSGTRKAIDSSPHSADPTRRDGSSLRTRLGARLEQARWALLWERLWPALWPPLGILGLFLLFRLITTTSTLPEGGVPPGWGPSHNALTGR